MNAIRAAARLSAARYVCAQPTARFAAAGLNGAQVRHWHDPHYDESFEEFTERYVEFFNDVDEGQELIRGLENAFAYDLVPAATVIEAVLHAARRLNTMTVGTRCFMAIREKCETQAQYEQYLEALNPLRKELGIPLIEELGYDH